MLQLLSQAQTVTLGTDFQPGDRYFYETALLVEAYLRFPELQADPALADRLRALKSQVVFPPYALLHDRSTAPFGQWIEAGLNQEREGIDEIEPWGRAKEALTVGFLTSSHDLFERPVEARVFQASPSTGLVGLFVVRTESAGRYRVFAIDDQWRAFPGFPASAQTQDQPTIRVQITDLNGNQRAEIAVTYQYTPLDPPAPCHQFFHLYEWDGSAFRDLMADPLEVLPPSTTSRCLAVTFAPAGAGIATISAGFEDDLGCPSQPYVEKDIYHWDGTAFQVDEPRLILPPAGLAPGRCTIAWAARAGPTRDLAVRMLAGALQNWPAAANEAWGPASRDYFTLKLATWHLQRGSLNEALALLEQVRDHPDAPSYSLSTRIADAFLDSYAENGISAALRSVSFTYRRALQSVPLENNRISEQALLEAWGFIEPGWGLDSKYDFGSDFSSIDALNLVIQQARPTRLEALSSALDQNDFPVQGLQQDDLDGDGRLDYFFVTYENRGETLVAILRPTGQFQVVRVASILTPQGSFNERVLGWQVFRPSAAAPPVAVLESQNLLAAFHFETLGQQRRAVVDLLQREVCAACPGQVADWEITGSGGQQFLTVRYTQGESVYAWDPNALRLIPTRMAPENQEAIIAQAERALFVEDDPAAAYESFEALLIQGVWETWPTRDASGPPRLRPYLLYLRALAAEQLGSADLALASYAQLWQDYPQNPFALAAYHKIERQP